jgi:tetratricopeptide (TPR) repeat protein
VIFKLNKKDLIKYFHHPDLITLDDLTEIEEILEKSPYFSIGHSLHAKASQIIGVAEKTESLRRAAVYTGNRPILKKWMQEGPQSIFITPTLSKSESQTNLKKAESASSKVESAVGVASVGTKITFTEPPKPSSEKEVYQEVLENLKRLQTNLHVFDQVEQELNEKLKLEEATTPSAKSKKAKSKAVLKSEEVGSAFEVKETKKKKETKKPSSIKPKAVKPEPKVVDAKDTPTKKKTTKIGQKKTEVKSVIKEENLKQGLDILDELLLMEGKAIKNDKLKAQLDIIDRFIEAEPQIKRKSPNEAYEPATSDVQDLTGDLNSLGDELLSENLAIILEKQGKKDRAIDIYKKLIWKFPQKKAYFAGRIEELKNLP